MPHISKAKGRSGRECAMTFCYPPRAISFLIILIFGICDCMALYVLRGRRIPLVRTTIRGNSVSGEIFELLRHELTEPSSIPIHYYRRDRRMPSLETYNFIVEPERLTGAEAVSLNNPKT